MPERLVIQIPDAVGDMPFNEARELADERLDEAMRARFGSAEGFWPETNTVEVAFVVAEALPRSPEGFYVSTTHEWRFEYELIFEDVHA